MVWDRDVDKDLLYDLRQTYAQILDEVLKRVAQARFEKNYIGWFGALDDLHTEINQKLTAKEITVYNTKLKETIKILNLYPETYRGLDQDAKKIYLIKSQLKSLEMWLKVKMETHKMFGAKGTREGL